MDIEIRLLQCALKLAEHSNFARAAKALHMSQPSLSRNIQELERRLGVSLFSRDRHGVEPTPEGSIFLEHATKVMARADDLMREMNLLRGQQKSELSIGAGVYPGRMFFDRAIGQLARQHPTARLSICYGNAYQLLPRLRQREFDFSVMYMANPNSDGLLEITPLQKHPLFFAVRAGHPLLQGGGSVSLAEIQEYPIATTSPLSPSSIRKFKAAVHLTQARRSPQSVPSIACDSLGMVRTIITESDAVGVFSLNILLPEVKAGTLSVLRVTEPLTDHSFSIVRLKSRALPPLGAKLIRLITESDEALAEWESRNIESLFDRGSRQKPQAGRSSRKKR